MIVDVDTHWELAHYPKGEHPLEPWRSELPRDLELLALALTRRALSLARWR